MNPQPSTTNHMYDNTIKDQFVELRAAGQSFGQISEQLGIVKSTLHRWEEERADDVARLRRRQWEEQEAEFGERIEDQLTNLVCRMKDCQFRIGQFTLDHYSLRDAFAILRESRREYFRLRGILMGTSSRVKKSASSVPSVVNQESTAPPFVSPVPSETRAADLPSRNGNGDVSENQRAEANKTERFQQNGTTGPLITNDLQQSKPESFDFPVAGTAASAENCEPSEQPANGSPLPRGEGAGEGQAGLSALSVPSSADAVHNPPSEPLNSSVASVASAVESPSEKSNKTERSAETSETNTRNTNDLQQSKRESFDSATPDATSGGASSAEPQIPVAPESDEGGSPQPSQNPATSSADAVHYSTGSKSLNPQPSTLNLSVVIPEMDERPWWEREPVRR